MDLLGIPLQSTPFIIISLHHMVPICYSVGNILTSFVQDLLFFRFSDNLLRE